jgi:hypothetical protein
MAEFVGVKNSFDFMNAGEDIPSILKREAMILDRIAVNDLAQAKRAFNSSQSRIALSYDVFKRFFILYLVGSLTQLQMSKQKTNSMPNTGN